MENTINAKKLVVKHDLFPENEILFNCDCWCDFCSTYLPEWKMTNIADAQVCEDCYEHYT